MDKSFESFFKVHERRIHFQINRLNIPRDLHPDFYAEGMIALWQAYQSFDPKRGNLGTYLNYRIRFRLIDLLRKKVQQEERIDKYIEQSKELLNDGNRYGTNKRPVIRVTELPLSNKPFWQEVKSHLTERQWKWVKYFIIAELTIKEIMEIEDVSADAVKGWGQAVRKKLRHEKIFKRLQQLL